MNLFFASALATTTRSQQEHLSSGSASADSASARLGTELIRADIEKLLMITEALWTILKEQLGYTDDKLIQMIQKIDLRDGKLNGKVARSTERSTCPQCGRVLIRNHPVCLYCGAVAKQKPFER